MSKTPFGARVLLLIILLLPLLTFAQNIITGQVVSGSDQSAVPGATIIIKGTKIGTSTGIDGKFSIRAKEGEVLVVSGIGVVQKEVSVGGETNLIITVATN